jgi:hypothetical protein
MPSRRRIAVVLSLALLLGACGAHRPLPRLLPPGDRVPVVLVPGITGSFLADAATGEIRWGRGRDLLGPHDGGNLLARPLAEEGPSNLRAAGVMEKMRLFQVIEKPIYGPVAELLAENGYSRSGEGGAGGQNVYLFGYDWRQDNLESAQRLAALLEEVAAHGRREVDLICQSNGAHLCRWVLKYGGLSLEEAEAGATASSGFTIRRLILVGTSNGGSLRILRELHRGRSYVPVIGRYIQPEVLFTMPSLYQDLPAYNPRPFLDDKGRALALELYDAEVWRRHGLSIFGVESRARADRRPEIFGDEAARFAFLERTLDRAKRFHQQLGRDLPVGATRFYSIQNTYEPTPHAVVLRNGELHFTGDAELYRNDYLKALAAAPGDGHATVESQQFLSRSEKAAFAAPPYFVSGPHFELILDPGALHRLLDFLR